MLSYLDGSVVTVSCEAGVPLERNGEKYNVPKPAINPVRTNAHTIIKTRFIT